MSSEDVLPASLNDSSQPAPPSEARCALLEQDKLHQRLRWLIKENTALKKRLAHIEASRLWKLGLGVTWLRKRLLGKRNPTSPQIGEVKPTETLPPPAQSGRSGSSQSLEAALAKHGATRHVAERLAAAKTNLHQLIKDDLGTLFLVPYKGSGGGLHSIVQEAEAMQMLGFRAAVAVPSNLKKYYSQTYPEMTVFRYFEDEEEILSWGKHFRVAVATYFSSLDLLEKLWLADPALLCAYYVQDYEPWFFTGGSEWERIAYRSYGRIPGMIHFAKTRFLCETVKERHSLTCHRVEPSFDHTVFSRLPPHQSTQDVCRVGAMIRPETPWRRPKETVEVLGNLKRKYGKAIEIHLFGCDPESKAFLALGADYSLVHHGRLLRREVAGLLNQMNVFLDLSVYQGFGRTGLEAMACGCVPILPEKCGPDTYAVQGVNAFLVNTGDNLAAEKAVTELLENPTQRKAMAASGLATAKRYSVPLTALEEILLFQREWRARKLDH